ncbi:MAG: insulinase family protein [Elusimicrobiota bacterium]|jgi:zinc protease|nr:insulinase family protein [Elusimicrobiota bacterium]
MRKYENGLQVIFAKDESKPLASVNILINVGAQNENAQESGFSHFIEHLIFKAGKKYPGLTFVKNIESGGGYTNAQTSKDITMYYVDIGKNLAGLVLKMFADMLIEPNFVESEVDMERLVVIEEIQSYLDEPEDILYEAFVKTIYKNSAGKNSILGTKENIKNAKVADILSFYKKHYIAKNIVIAVAGNFDEKEIYKIIDETFAKLPKVKQQPLPNIYQKNHKTPMQVLEANTENSFIINGFLGPDIKSDEMFAAETAMQVLGGGRSSRLVQKLKRQDKIVYDINCWLNHQRGTTFFANFAITKKENLKKVNAEICAQIEKIIASGITPQECERSKTALLSQWAFQHQNISSAIQEDAYWLLMDRKNYSKNYMQNIKKVKAADIKNFFKKYYQSQFLTTVCLTSKEAK